MSSYASLIPTAIGAGSAVSSSMDRSASLAAQNQEINRRNQLIAAQQVQQAQQKRNLLDQQQASARAQMGVWGTGGDGGSAAAILQGMAQRTADSIAGDDQVSALKMQKGANLLTSGSNSAAAGGLGVFQSFYDGMK
ncbi:MAG: hypothetical protein Q7R40_18435 [Phaeospirillum sp.]|nr:hypothetical protein [Phaeospirillum sp.]